MKLVRPEELKELEEYIIMSAAICICIPRWICGR